MATVGRVSGLVCALVLAGVVTSCGENDRTDEAVAGEPSASAPGTVTDLRGDVWMQDVPDRRSPRTTNVDLTELDASYDDAGLVLTVSYAEPLDQTARNFGLVVNLDHDPDTKSDVIALDWSNERPKTVTVSDRVDYMYFCKARVDTDYTAGTVTLTLPSTAGCLGKTPPERLRVLYLTSTAGGAWDHMFTDGQSAAEADFWVSHA